MFFQLKQGLGLGGNNPKLSPDGTKIAFHYCYGCPAGINNEIYVYDIQNDRLTRVTDDPAPDSYPSWSPDGYRIIFSSGRDYFNADSMRYRTDLYTANIDGSGLKRITNNGYATRPAWAPDGRKIAYERKIGVNEVYLMYSLNGDVSKLDSKLVYTGNPMWNRSATQLLVYGRDEKNDRLMKLFRVDINNVELIDEAIFEDEKRGMNYDWYNEN